MWSSDTPTAGTPLMQANQMTGLDLPMKALAWEDEDGEVWLTYPDVTWIADRYGLGSDVATAIQAIRAGMATVVVKAAGL